MTLRTYLVKGSNGVERLIKAATKGQAMHHIASTSYTITVATQEDLERLLPKLLRVEKAGEAPLPPQEPSGP